MSAEYRALRAIDRAIVACQGERGSYSDAAIDRVWGGRVSRRRYRDFAGAVRSVVDRVAHFAVLPVHNAVIGEIVAARDAIATGGLVVRAEVSVRVRHCLLAPPGATLEGLRVVFSHVAALDQCRRFLERHPWIVPESSHDTAGAALEVASRGQITEGAIASDACADGTSLVVLARDVADSPLNATRFAIVSLAWPADAA